MNISFTVPGPPVGKARARSGNGHHYTPQKTRDYESMVKQLAAEAMAGRPMIQGPVTVWIAAFLPATKADQKRIDRGEQWHATKKPDADNISKSILDGMNQIVFADDSQVADLSIVKWIGSSDPTPRVVVHAREAAHV